MTYAKAGDCLRICAEMAPDTIQANLGVFGAMRGRKLAPHVPTYQGQFLKGGRPMFVTPVVIRLHEQRRTAEIEIKVEFNMRFRVLQDITEPGKPFAKIGTYVNGHKYTNARAFYDRARDWIAGLGERIFSAVRRPVGRRTG